MQEQERCTTKNPTGVDESKKMAIFKMHQFVEKKRLQNLRWTFQVLKNNSSSNLLHSVPAPAPKKTPLLGSTTTT